MVYILKPGAPAFDVVDGPFAGKTFRHDIPYTDIPPADAGKFQKKKTPPATATANPTTEAATKNGGNSEVDTQAPLKTPKKGGSK